MLEILIDGFTGTHRILAPYTGVFYTLLISVIEILSVLAFIATIVFLSRRNILKVQRFHKPEMKGWPFKDANLILLGEILLILGIFIANSSDLVLQEEFLKNITKQADLLYHRFLQIHCSTK